MIKSLEVRVDTFYGTKSLVKGISSNPSWACDFLSCLLVTGYLTTPPRCRPLALSTYWAWLRYSIAVSRSPQLKLRRSWEELDAHQKTILADDFGIGFPSYFLIENHGFEDFADTAHLLKTTLKGRIKHVKLPKRGPPKTPDLLAVDGRGKIHVLECKGTQSTKKALKDAVELGIRQKKNLISAGPKSIIESCMVGGIFVPQHSSRESAELLFVDPPVDPRIGALEELGASRVSTAIRRHSLAKSLALCGLWDLSEALDTPSNNINAKVALEENGLKLHEYKREDNMWSRSIAFRIIEQERSREALSIKLDINMPNELKQAIKDSTDSRGKLSHSNMEKWLKEKTTKQRDLRNTMQDASSLGAWSFQSEGSDDKFSYTTKSTLPSGINLNLNIEKLNQEAS